MAGADRATLEGYLAEAKAAYHALAIGGQAREIQDQNGERVTYTATSTRTLLGYIMQLEQQIAALGGPAAPLGPMRVII